MTDDFPSCKPPFIGDFPLSKCVCLELTMSMSTICCHRAAAMDDLPGTYGGCWIFSWIVRSNTESFAQRKKGIVTNMHKHSSVYITMYIYMRIFAEKWVLTLTPNMLAYRAFDVLLKSTSAAVGLNMTLHAVFKKHITSYNFTWYVHR